MRTALGATDAVPPGELVVMERWGPTPRIKGIHVGYHEDAGHVAFTDNRGCNGSGSIILYYRFPDGIDTKEKQQEHIESLLLLLKAQGWEIADDIPWKWGT